jgi:flagellar biosynthetic protein FliR
MPTLPVHLEACLLIVIRTGGMLLSAPWFGHRALPPQLKIGLALLIGLLLAPAVAGRGIALPDGLLAWAVAIAGELLLGIAIGLLVRFLFAAVAMAGQLIGLEVGLAMPGLFDPEFNEHSTALHTFTDLLAVLVFLSLDAHHLLLRGLADSFRAIPLLGWGLGGAGVEAVVRLSAELWPIALRLAAPLLAAQFLAKVAMALVAKAAPQINILMVGFPLQIGLGLLVLALMLPTFTLVLGQLFDDLGLQLAGWLALLKR